MTADQHRRLRAPATSEQTTTVLIEAPVDTVPPSITGTAAAGPDPDGLDRHLDQHPDGYTYQWRSVQHARRSVLEHQRRDRRDVHADRPGRREHAAVVRHRQQRSRRPSWPKAPPTSLVVGPITEFSTGHHSRQLPPRDHDGPDGNLWFTEAGGRRGSGGSHPREPSPSSPRASPPAAARTGSPRARKGTSGSPRPKVAGSGGSPQQASSPSSPPASPPEATRSGSRRARTGTSGSPSTTATIGRITPDRRHHRVLHRPDRRQLRRWDRRRRRTGTSGSPRRAAAGSARSRPRASITEYSTGITTGQRTIRDHRRPGREPLVHRVQRQQDREDHHRGRHHRVLHRHHRRQRPVWDRRGRRRKPLVRRVQRQQDRADHSRGSHHRVLRRHHRR